MKKIINFLASIFMLPLLIHANPENDKLFEKHTYVHGRDTLPYRLMRPLNILEGQHYPLLILLHGSGERGRDNEKQLIHGAGYFADSISRYPCFMLVPQCPENKRWVNMDWSLVNPVQPENISLPLQLTVNLTDSLIQSLPVDPSRIYITGISMGGQGVWDLLYRFPGKFAAAVPVCGSADSIIAPVIKDIPLWAFHGENDDVVPLAAMENLIVAIRTAGGKPVFSKFQGVGHNAWDYAYKDPLLLQWLFTQQKK
ncbi:MAG: dienelactone hydrolase family protein [Bacteroidales bacterium]